MRKTLKILLGILLGAAPLAAQTINPNQIKPGTNGYVITTNMGISVWKPLPSAAFQSLTTTGTSGAAMLGDGVLNIPQYQGALTLTTTGSSGAATLIGNTLNIPQYSGSSSGVSEIIPGTNVTCSPNTSGFCVGNVTVNASGGSGPAANTAFVFAGDSKNDDDSNAIEPTFALSGFTCATGTCTVINTGTNGLAAGDWVNMRFSTAWTSTFSAPTDIAFSTSYTLFKVLSSGLSSTQFEFSYSGTGTCASTCGNAAKATFNLPFNTTSIGSLKGVGSTSVIIPNPVNIQTLASDYATILHPLSPAVTGNPAFLIIGDEEDDVASSPCTSAATIEAAFQSLWASAHTDGYSVVEWSATAFSYNQTSIGSCVNGYQTLAAVETWLAGQAKGAANYASGEYWDLFADAGRVVNDAYNTNLVASNGGFGPGGVGLAAADIAQVMATGVSDPLSKKGEMFGSPASQSSAGNGFLYFPTQDSIRGWTWLDTAWDTWLMTLGTQMNYRHLTVNSDSTNLFQDTDTGGSNATVISFNELGTVSSGANNPIFTSFTPNLPTGTNPFWLLGHDSAIKNSFGLQFHYVGAGSASNNMTFAVNGENGINLDGAGNFVIQGISSSTAPICPNGTGGALTTSGCVAGTSVNVNGTPVSSPNFNAAAPAPDAGYTAATFKVSSSNVIAETQDYLATSPIVVTGRTISCPTCGTGSGGTSVSQNSGSAETNLPITGFMPQICADSSGSGTAQSCTVANTFVPQTGNCVVYSTTTANSGTGLTVNVNSLGAKSVAVAGSSGWTTTLTASLSIPAGHPMNLCYDGTNWNASGTGYLPSGGGTLNPFSAGSSQALTGVVYGNWSAIGGNTGGGGSPTNAQIAGLAGPNSAIEITSPTGGGTAGPWYGVQTAVSGAWTHTFVLSAARNAFSTQLGDYVGVAATDGTKWEGVIVGPDSGDAMAEWPLVSVGLNDTAYSNSGSLNSVSGTTILYACGQYVFLQLSYSGSSTHTITGATSCDGGATWITQFSESVPFLTPSAVAVITSTRGGSAAFNAFFESYQ